MVNVVFAIIVSSRAFTKSVTNSVKNVTQIVNQFADKHDLQTSEAYSADHRILLAFAIASITSVNCAGVSCWAASERAFSGLQ